jgi:hypothetical protein
LKDHKSEGLSYRDLLLYVVISIICISMWILLAIRLHLIKGMEVILCYLGTQNEGPIARHNPVSLTQGSVGFQAFLHGIGHGGQFYHFLLIYI